MGVLGRNPDSHARKAGPFQNLMPSSSSQLPLPASIAGIGAALCFAVALYYDCAGSRLGVMLATALEVACWMWLLVTVSQQGPIPFAARGWVLVVLLPLGLTGSSQLLVRGHVLLGILGSVLVIVCGFTAMIHVARLGYEQARRQIEMEQREGATPGGRNEE